MISSRQLSPEFRHYLVVTGNYWAFTQTGGLLALWIVGCGAVQAVAPRLTGRDGVSRDVGFYYMANAMGRLTGTVLSGWVFQLAGQGVAGLATCLWISAGMLLATVIISLGLPTGRRPVHQAEAD